METGEEVPYASAVVIERYEEPPANAKTRKDGKLPVTNIAAAIFCEAIGAEGHSDRQGGAKLKAIGASARQGDRIAAGHARVSGAARHC